MDMKAFMFFISQNKLFVPYNRQRNINITKINIKVIFYLKEIILYNNCVFIYFDKKR